MNARPARILTIDDEALVREILTAYLEADGFAVDEAGTGAGPQPPRRRRVTGMLSRILAG